MENYTQMNELLESGRYECDLQFHKKLFVWTRALDFYDFDDKIKRNVEVVGKIVQLTNQHSNSLAEHYNQDRAVEIAGIIKQQIKKIDTKSAIDAVRICNQMQGESYHQKVRNLISKCEGFRQDYAQVCTRAWKTISSDQLKVDTIAIIAFYLIKNKEKLKPNLVVYNKVMEKGISHLKDYSQNLQFIEEHPQIQQFNKVQQYVCGSLIIVTVLLRFYNIIKAMEGRSNLSFKLTSLKTQIEGSLKRFPKIAEQNIDQAEIPVEDMKALLRGHKQKGKIINGCCNWCLKPGADFNNVHKSCHDVIAYFMKGSGI